jgi:hypothetical protein
LVAFKVLRKPLPQSGKNPDTRRIFEGVNKMSKRTYEAAELAKVDGVTLNQFIAAAVAEKVGTLRTAREVLQQRAGSAKRKDPIKYLRRAPKVAPVAGDERDS